MGGQSSQERSGYTLGELAAVSGVPARTIRYYQSLNLLSPPRRNGREAVYDAAHRDRLRLVGEMRERGLRLNAIQDLLTRDGQATRAVIDWLGLDETLHAPWTEDRPRVCTAEELNRQLAGCPPDALSTLESVGLVRPVDESAVEYLVARPGLLQVTMRLVAAGLDLDLVVLAGEILRGYLAGAAGALTLLFNERLGNRVAGDGGGTVEVVLALQVLKAVARESAGLTFAHEIEAAVRRIRVHTEAAHPAQADGSTGLPA